MPTAACARRSACRPEPSIQDFAIPRSTAIMLPRAAVAQLDRVLGYEPRGRGFDSCQPHQLLQDEWLRKKFLGHFSFRPPYLSCQPIPTKVALALCQMAKLRYNTASGGCSSAG